MEKIVSKMLKMCIVAALAVCSPVMQGASDELQDQPEIAYRQTYAFKMSLQVPRIYNNTESLGYRKYQHQTINGQLSLDYALDGKLAGMSFTNLVNRTHRLSNGKNVTYEGLLDDDKEFKIVAIGSNKTGSFKTASICFSLMAEPSYNIGPFDQDTSLYVTLAGKGNVNKNGEIKTARGYVSGTLGCGCYYYGHLSPTRKIWWYGVSDETSDIAGVHGTWQMRFVK